MGCSSYGAAHVAVNAQTKMNENAGETTELLAAFAVIVLGSLVFDWMIQDGPRPRQYWARAVGVRLSLIALAVVTMPILTWLVDVTGASMWLARTIVMTGLLFTWTCWRTWRS